MAFCGNQMKRTEKITLTILAIIMSFAITTCSGNSAGGGARIGSSAGNGGGGGTGGNGVDVTITLPSFRAAGASWSVPSGDRPFVSYTITLNGPSTASKTVSIDEPTATFTVLAGDYNISIQAVYSKSGSPVAKGSTSVEVKAGKKNTATINLGPVYNAGDRGPGGGWVYYIADGWNGRSFGFTMADTGEKCFYLEVAPEPTSGPLIGFPTWESGSPSNTGAIDVSIGAGRMNTSLILKNGNSDAARECNNYRANGYDDWFLPSENELISLRNFIITDSNTYIALLGIDTFYYWSSTEVDSNNAIVLYLTVTTPPTGYGKVSSCRVRPIRAF